MGMGWKWQKYFDINSVSCCNVTLYTIVSSSKDSVSQDYDSFLIVYLMCMFFSYLLIISIFQIKLASLPLDQTFWSRYFVPSLAVCTWPQKPRARGLPKDAVHIGTIISVIILVAFTLSVIKLCNVNLA